MKKSKILLVSMLSLILCFMCVTSTTFSWFTRPQSKDGDSLAWNASYTASDGSEITMTTYESTDGTTFGDTEVTNFSGSVSAGSRKYYRTDITNKGSTAQSVSLYLSGLELGDSSNSFYLGVNGPLKTYKNYDPNSVADTTYTKVSSSTVRIYFQPNDVDSWKETTTTIKIRCGTGSSTDNPNFSSGITMTVASGASTRTLYADIPLNSTYVQIYANDDPSGSNATPYMKLYDYCPNLSATQSYVFKLQANVDGLNNHNCDTYEVSGADIANYYDTITIEVGQTFSAALIQGTDYRGTISYSSSNSSIFSVTSGGTITAIKVGTATLTTTTTGSSYGDTMSKTTTVRVVAKTEVESSVDFPIVTNLKIAAAGTDANGEDTYTTESVYWYIKNDADSGTLTYKVSDLILTL